MRAQLENVNEIFAEKLAETAVQGLTALAEVATTPVDEPLDWATKLEAIRLIVERAIPPGVFPAPAPYHDWYHERPRRLRHPLFQASESGL